MSLGYENVKRYAGGWHAWLAFTGQSEPGQAPAGLALGDFFPSCRLVVLNNKSDRAYLGLPADAKAFALSEVKADYLFVELYSELCYGCLQEVASYNHLFQEIEADSFLKGRLKMLGLGVDSSYRAVVKFRRQHQVRFPLFADRGREVFSCLGQPELPTAYLLERQPNGRWKIELILSGHIGDTRAVLSRLKTAMAPSKP